MSRITLWLAFLPAFILLAVPAYAGTFDLSASVDHDHLELGESLQFQLHLRLNGNMDFPPALDPSPTFEGFQAQGGPSQSQNITWINGAMTMEVTLTWELVAQKSGDLVLGPYRASGKDALAGNVVRETKPIHIHVSRPKNLGFTLPSQNPTEEPTPDENIRDIKADRPFPWGLLAGVVVGLTALAGLLLWWWLRPAKPKQEVVPRDPAQLALEQLEKLRQGMQPGGEPEFVRAATAVLRQYLRFRLELRNEATLSEALKALQRATPTLAASSLADWRLRTELLLYAGREVQPADTEAVYQGARSLILEHERQRDTTPDLTELRQSLESASERWTEGQKANGWRMMRSALLAFLRRRAGTRSADDLRAWLDEALQGLETPDLLAAADLTFSEKAPDQYPATVVESLMRLAKVLVFKAEPALPETADALDDSKD
jgi:hypothetical protein